MRITCPACEAAYDVPEGLVGPRRSVRCARCARAWVPGLPPEPEPGAAPPAAPAPAVAPAPAALTPPAVVEPPPEPAPPAMPDPVPEPEPPPPIPPASLADEAPMEPVPAPPAPSGRALRSAWALSLLLLLGLAGAIWLFRGDIAAAWPPAQRLWSATGG